MNRLLLYSVESDKSALLCFNKKKTKISHCNYVHNLLPRKVTCHSSYMSFTICVGYPFILPTITSLDQFIFQV